MCPAKDKANPKHKSLDMAPQKPLRDAERDNFAFFLDLPEADRTTVRLDVKGAQFLQPLFEFSGACSGCGETPYVKLLTQLFGDRALIANATGCSSIYGGNLPTTPYRTNAEGRGPAWSNSLFEDNAEFGLGFRLALDSFQDQARTLVKALAPRIGDTLAGELLTASQETEAEIAAQRERVLALKTALKGVDTPEARRLLLMADSLVKKSVWIVGGDGWAYDIGYGGLDHVLASGRKVNILVLDTEVYSNTGGQQSKATPLGAAAKFAAKGKSTPKKDLGMLAMTYGNVYVAHVAFGAKDAQTVKALLEAESYPGTSIVIAYSPCIAHGYDLSFSLDQQKLASESGYWPLYRFDPRRIATGETPLLMDTAQIKGSIAQFMRNEARFRMVEQQDAPRFLEPAREGRARGEEPLPGVREPREADDRPRGRSAGALRRFPPRPCRRRAGRPEETTMDLTTRYLGLTLPHPFMPGASPMVDDLDLVRRLEDAGAAAIVMHSLFEEQITREEVGTIRQMEIVSGSYPEALTYFPEPEAFLLGPERYLDQVRRLKQAVRIPVIASLNGATPGGWVTFATRIAEAGADALELNLYDLGAHDGEPGFSLERRFLEIVRSVKAAVRIPVAVKLSPFFSSLGSFASELDGMSVDGLVLFNRFYQPDIDPETLDVTPALRLSTHDELLLRLRWLAMLSGRVKASLAVTGGVHDARRRDQGDHGRRRRRPDGLGASPARPEGARRGARRRRRGSWRSTSTNRWPR